MTASSDPTTLNPTLLRRRYSRLSPFQWTVYSLVSLLGHGIVAIALFWWVQGPLGGSGSPSETTAIDVIELTLSPEELLAQVPASAPVTEAPVGDSGTGDVGPEETNAQQTGAQETTSEEISPEETETETAETEESRAESSPELEPNQTAAQQTSDSILSRDNSDSPKAETPTAETFRDTARSQPSQPQRASSTIPLKPIRDAQSPTESSQAAEQAFIEEQSSIGEPSNPAGQPDEPSTGQRPQRGFLEPLRIGMGEVLRDRGSKSNDDSTENEGINDSSPAKAPESTVPESTASAEPPTPKPSSTATAQSPEQQPEQSSGSAIIPDPIPENPAPESPNPGEASPSRPETPPSQHTPAPPPTSPNTEVPKPTSPEPSRPNVQVPAHGVGSVVRRDSQPSSTTGNSPGGNGSASNPPDASAPSAESPTAPPTDPPTSTTPTPTATEPPAAPPSESASDPSANASTEASSSPGPDIVLESVGFEVLVEATRDHYERQGDIPNTYAQLNDSSVTGGLFMSRCAVTSEQAEKLAPYLNQPITLLLVINRQGKIEQPSDVQPWENVSVSSEYLSVLTCELQTLVFQPAQQAGKPIFSELIIRASLRGRVTP